MTDTPGERAAREARAEEARDRSSLYRGWGGKTKLAKALDVLQPDLTRVLTGNRPGHDLWPRIAEALEVSHGWLLRGEPQPEDPAWVRRVATPTAAYTASTPRLADPKLWPKTKTPLPDTTRPDFDECNPDQTALVGTVSAGTGAISYLERPRAFRRRKHPVMRVVGNSAYPVAYDGQFVEVDLDTLPRHNNLVVVETVENDETGMPVHRSYLKRYCIDARAPDGYVLASVNAGIDSPYIPHEQILAMRRVVGVIFEE